MKRETMIKWLFSAGFLYQHKNTYSRNYRFNRLFTSCFWVGKTTVEYRANFDGSGKFSVLEVANLKSMWIDSDGNLRGLQAGLFSKDG